jgi:hypothetical protein
MFGVKREVLTTTERKEKPTAMEAIDNVISVLNAGDNAEIERRKKAAAEIMG